MIEMREAIIVAFPLRGEWFSPNTPGTKIPSHGTNQLGTRYAYKNAHYFDPQKDDVQSVAGNYIIIENSEHVYAAFCHLQTGSVQVSVGQHVKKGDVIGKVGHSGNSFAPHLHFQLMDRSDIATANGLPCAFEALTF